MLLLVATHRDDEPEAEGLLAVREALSPDGDGRDVDVRPLPLGALTAAEARRLAQQLLADSGPGRVERVVHEGAGSPFLIGELARAAEHDASPGDLRSAILARVEALSKGRRAVLHALCVAPRPVGTPMARAWSALCRGALSLWGGCDDLGLHELQRAEQLLSAKDNRGMARELSYCRYMMHLALLARGGPRACNEHSARCLRLADAAGDRWGRIIWRIHGVHRFNELGTEPVRAELLRAREIARGLQSSSTSGSGLAMLAWLDAVDGNWPDALAHMERAFEEHAGRGRSWTTLELRMRRACVFLGAVAHGVGDRRALLDRVQRDAEVIAAPRNFLGEPIAFPLMAGRADFLRGQLAAARGQRAEALSHFERAVEDAKRSPLSRAHFVHKIRLGELLGGERGAELCAEAERGMAELGADRRWREVWAARF